MNILTSGNYLRLSPIPAQVCAQLSTKKNNSFLIEMILNVKEILRASEQLQNDMKIGIVLLSRNARIRVARRVNLVDIDEACKVSL